MIKFAGYILLILLYGIESHADNWIVQQTPTSENLFSCSFPDKFNGWASGAWGTIIRTSNSGNTWELQSSGLDYPIVSISFVTPLKGWAIGNKFLYTHPVILSTSNGGYNWNFYNFPDSTKAFRTICFIDSLNGYVGTYDGSIIKTTNGGINWNETQKDTSLISYLEIKKFAFLSNSYIIAAGGAMDIAGYVKKSTDYGSTWSGYAVTGEPINDIRFIDSNYIIAVGGDLEFGSFVYKSTNSGTNYQIDYLPVFGMSFSICPRTRTEWWISMGYAQKFLLTFNSGQTYHEIASPQNSAIYDIVFKDSINGWCVGTNGLAAKYNNSSIGVKKEEIPLSNFYYQLFPIYPNPFNSSTYFRWEMVKPGNVKITLFDITGKKIREIEDRKFSAGKHQLFFSADNIPSGVYYFTFESNSVLNSGKIVIIK